MKKDTIIVGIGASAGGLDAIQKLFDKIPANTGMCFVVIQHLSPDYKSLMPELLAKHTKMQIIDAKEKMTLKPNCIYLNQRNKNLVVKGNKLYLLDPGPKHNLNLPIDIFFHTLGEEFKDNAVGIILSGTGSDGSRGIKTINENGGTVIVQNPTTAQFDGMPNTAISTNIVDFILEPEEIAAVLQKVPKHNFLIETVKSDPTTHAITFQNILSEILLVTGIDFSKYKENTLLRRLEKRLHYHNIENLHDYYVHLKGNSKEVNILKKDFLIGVTNFFRDTNAFESLKKKVIPELVASAKKNKQLRIWIAGCSTGEEVYSIAIILDEYIKNSGSLSDFKIFATDIDSIALANASDGMYNFNISTEIDKKYLNDYFIKRGGKIQIIKRIREKIVFSNHDVLKNPPFIKLDLVVCRNLLIYLNNKSQQKVISTFQFALNKFGYLFLGVSETIGELNSLFKTVDNQYKIFQNISEKKYFDSQEIREKNTIQTGNKVDSHQTINKPYYVKTDPEHIFYKLLSTKHSPPSIFIDEEYNILFLNGDIGKILSFKQGVFEKNLLKLVDKETARGFRNGIQRVNKHKEPVKIENIVSAVNNISKSFDVIFHLIHEVEQPIYLLEFVAEKDVSTDIETFKIDTSNYTKINDERILDLEQELTEYKTRLQNTVEALETTNEELQSSNEELMASNEELQSTNEELQSVNEELYTVNSELQEKNKELNLLNDDISNLFNSSEIGTLFLDDNLLIRRFTPALVKHFDLKESDIGRPITSFKSNFTSEVQKDLMLNASECISTLETFQSEIQDNKGNYFLQRTLPFITSEKKVAGVVMTFVDITQLYQSQHNYDLAKNRFDLAASAANIVSWEWNPQTDIIIAGEDWDKLFGIQKNDVTKNWLDYVDATDKQKVQTALENHIKGIVDIYHVEFGYTNPSTNEHMFIKAVGKIIMFNDQKEPIKMAGVCIDITKEHTYIESIKKAEKKAQEASELKNIFLANMSHEIRTPMNSIIGFSSMLKNKKLTEDKKNTYVDIVTQNANHLLHLIDDIINISKIEANQVKSHSETFDLNDFLTSKKIELENQIRVIKKKTIEVILELPEKLNFEKIIADKLHLNQILTNLFSNALKFTEKGSITFGYNVTNDLLNFYVKDTGRGIEEDKQNLIFEQFKQAKTEDAIEFDGTGLGLAICKGLLENMGGSISVASEVDKGSTFFFTIPLISSSNQNVKKTTHKKNLQLKSNNPTILVVDNNHFIHTYFESIFEDTNITLLKANSVLEAIDVFKNNSKIDITFMDIRMPGMKGDEAAKIIKELDPNACIIAQTAQALTEDREMYLNQHVFCEYLTKPLDAAQIFELVNRLA